MFLFFPLYCYILFILWFWFWHRPTLSINLPGLITNTFKHPSCESHWPPPEIWEHHADVLIQGWKQDWGHRSGWADQGRETRKWISIHEVYAESSLDICACTYPAFYSNSARIFLSVNSPGLITTIFNHPCRESHWPPPEIWERDADILIQGWNKTVDFDPDRQTKVKKYGSVFEVMKLIRSEPSCVHLRLYLSSFRFWLLCH